MAKKALNPPGARKKFTTRYVVTIETDIDVNLLREVMSPEWQRDLYLFRTEQDAADHLAFNLAQERSLLSLDGFAHRDPKDVTTKIEWDLD